VRALKNDNYKLADELKKAARRVSQSFAPLANMYIECKHAAAPSQLITGI